MAKRQGAGIGVAAHAARRVRAPAPALGTGGTTRPRGTGPGLFPLRPDHFVAAPPGRRVADLRERGAER